MKITTLIRSLIFCCLLTTLSTVRAQYVAIPDLAFANYLKTSGYVSCLTGNDTIGWQMDTTCTAVTSATTMNMSLALLRDLTGITYFKNLRSLSIMPTIFTSNPDSLSYIPALPASLKYLRIENSPRLTTLPTLPAGLDTFICNSTSVITLPTLPASLLYLSCTADKLSSLPALPSSLQYLNCDDNNSTLLSLPALPSSLTYLNCATNYLITSMPALPASLIYLNCEADRLTSLPTLPSTLTTLLCGYNRSLHSLPALPASLATLTCSTDSLYALPTLPSSLLSLTCSYNPLLSLPIIPASLTTLNCSADSLSILPTLPSTLQTLDYSYNPLTVQPPLPAKLKNLTCDGSSFTTLPALPDSLVSLYCSYSAITSLPPLPHTINGLKLINDTHLYCIPPILSGVVYTFYIQGSHITCMPNHVVMFILGGSYDTNPASLPLCTPSTGCDFYYNISGNVHLDTSATCTQDSLRPGKVMPHMKLLLKKNGQIIQQEYTSGFAQYAFKTDSFRTYTVDLDTTGLPFAVVCPASGSRTAVLSSTDTVEFNQNFGIQCRGIDTFDTDYGIGSIYSFFSPFRPGHITHVEVNAGDVAYTGRNSYCSYETLTADTSGTITTTITGPAHYVAPATGALVPTSVSGNTLTYTIANLKKLRQSGLFTYGGSLDIIVATDTTAAIGSSVCITSVVTPATPDINAGNDSFSHCFAVVNSWDPNHKDVEPADTIRSGDWLTYTIHFQNKGTAPALTIVVKDTLSQYVDETSFEYLASSHNNVVQIKGNTVIFTFPQINLVDSTVSDLLSQGWVRYRVRSKPNLPLLTQVQNTAYIYFDLNPAVVTNTATNTVDTLAAPLAIASLAEDGTVRLYPNPNKGTFTLWTSASLQNEYTVTDMLGAIIEQKAIIADKQQINLSNTAAGVYTIVVKGTNASQPLRFVVVK